MDQAKGKPANPAKNSASRVHRKTSRGRAQWLAQGAELIRLERHPINVESPNDLRNLIDELLQGCLVQDTLPNSLKLLAPESSSVAQALDQMIGGTGEAMKAQHAATNNTRTISYELQEASLQSWPTEKKQTNINSGRQSL